MCSGLRVWTEVKLWDKILDKKKLNKTMSQLMEWYLKLSNDAKSIIINSFEYILNQTMKCTNSGFFFFNMKSIYRLIKK